jgi:putative heme transporter
MKRLLKRIGPAVLGVAIVVAVFGFALPRIASYRDVVEVVSALSGWEIAALLAAVIWNILTFAPPWRAAMPGLGLWRALVVTQASTAAASVFPGGEAVGVGLTFGMLNGWGFRRTAIVAAVAVVSALNLLAKVLLPVAALAGLVVTGREGGLLPLLTLIGVAAVSLVLGAGIAALRTDASTRAFGARLDGWRRRIPLVRRRAASGPLGERLSHFRSESIGLLRRRWLQLTVWTLLGHTAVFIVLLVTLRAVGVTGDQVSVVEAFAAWALTRLLTAIPITPGGIGIIELGLTGALVAAGGPNDAVVAAVLLYRLLTWLPSILLGAPAALLWRRMHPVATT